MAYHGIKMDKANVLDVEFKITNPGVVEADNVYEMNYTLDNFGTEGPKKESKLINKKTFDFIQYHLKNIIGE